MIADMQCQVPGSRLTYFMGEIKIIGMIRFVRNLVFLCLIFLLGYIFGIKEVRFFKIVSSSMEPTLQVGDRIASVRKDRLRRHDIVVLQAPSGERERLVKRVIGLPHETVEVKDGKVFVNGEKINERYIKESPAYKLKVETGENGYFLLGDNRNESEDSSSWGPVDGELIMGRIFCRYWPSRKFRLFSGFSIFNR